MSQQVDSVSVTIKGRAALLFLLLLAGIFLWQFANTQDVVDPDVEKALRVLLASEYILPQIPSVRRALDANDEDELNARVQALTTLKDRIRFISLRRRGGKGRFVVRAEIVVDEGPPPAGPSVRYFRFNHSSLLGVVHESEATAIEYLLPFMD